MINEAADQNARLVVVQIDTPGGLDSSMREITQAILASPVPVAVYVTPAGARAASAGLFILLAGHIAAMSPSTNTGAAHPVGLGGDVDETAANKAVNDAAATIRTLAEQHNRNAAWAEQAVRESVSITEKEALELNVIDLVATSLEDLLRQLDGQTVETTAGSLSLQVSDAPRHSVSMNFAEQFLHVLSDPNIAYILLSIGSIGILAELYNPGALFPGITGAIALILAFFSLGNLPTNWAGVALVGLAAVLLVAELNTDGTGVLGAGAVVAFVLGGLILFRPFLPASPVLPDLHVDPRLIGATTVGIAGFVLLVVRQVVRSRKAPLLTGHEQFIGQIGRVHQDLRPNGRVRFQGQLWYARAHAGEEIAAGQDVRIVEVDGLTLVVEPVKPGTATNRAK
ncbi:MAG: nodulation protein NfeD [Anaerolineae bacterium]|nr:nodulation protein NfeD [Anaerolineae bacterium]